MLLLLTRAIEPIRNIETLQSYALDKYGHNYLLTAQCRNIKVGDLIQLSDGSIFRVLSIDYYLDPDDMFIAEIGNV
jgi:hypothetical protein